MYNFREFDVFEIERGGSERCQEDMEEDIGIDGGIEQLGYLVG